MHGEQNGRRIFWGGRECGSAPSFFSMFLFIPTLLFLGRSEMLKSGDGDFPFGSVYLLCVATYPYVVARLGN